MSHTNSTTNYSLPQFLTTDKPAWLTDVNNAYLAIDTAMKNNADAASTADTKATDAGTAATNADTKATAAKSAADGAIASISDTFSDTNTYSVNDVVVYNNLLYICTTAVITPGAWTGSANWTRTTLEALIDAVKAEADANTSAVTNLTNTSCSISKITGLPAGVGTPTISRRGNVVLVTFATEFVPGTYTELWNISPAPNPNTWCTVSIAGGVNQLKTTSSKIAFNTTTTITGNTYMIGQMVYTV